MPTNPFSCIQGLSKNVTMKTLILTIIALIRSCFFYFFGSRRSVGFVSHIREVMKSHPT